MSAMIPESAGLDRQTRVAAALTKAGVPNQLLTIPKGGHGNFTPEERTRIFATIREFLQKQGSARRRLRGPWRVSVSRITTPRWTSARRSLTICGGSSTRWTPPNQGDAHILRIWEPNDTWTRFIAEARQRLAAER